jgi:hypothetical protein
VSALSTTYRWLRRNVVVGKRKGQQSYKWHNSTSSSGTVGGNKADPDPNQQVKVVATKTIDYNSASSPSIATGTSKGPCRTVHYREPPRRFTKFSD